MAKFSSFRSVIELWPTRESCAADVGATAGQVSKWWQRESIPPEWWRSVVRTSIARKAGVTGDVLIDLAAAEAAV